MASVTQIPLMNEIRFVPQSEIPDIYNQKQFDRVRFCKSRLYFQVKKPFKILKQVEDSNCIHIHTNNTDVELQIWDKDGNILDTLFPDSFIMPGNIVNGEQLTTYQWSFRLTDILPGTTGFIYYAIKSTTPLFLVDEYVPSEPIWVKTKWVNTIVLTYTHDENDYSVVFSMGPVFNIRVQGYYLYEDSKTADTQFNNQKNSTRTLNSEKTRVFKYNAKKIPSYMIDKIVEAFRCNNTKVEGVRFTKDDGASFEFDKSDTASLYSGSILLQEYNPDDSFTFLSEQFIPLFDIGDPFTAPFVILDAALVTPGNVFKWLIQNTPTLIEDDTDAIAQIVAFNAMKAGLGLLGDFDIQNGIMGYVNDITESFVPFTNGKFKNYGAAMLLNGANASTDFGFINFDKIVIDWNGSLELVSPSVSLQTITHNFMNVGPSGTNIRVFHNDDIQTFTTVNPGLGNAAQIVSFNGSFPTSLQTIDIQSIDPTVTSLNLTSLIPSRQSLRQITIKNSPIVTFTLPFNNGLDFSTNFNNLSLVDFSSNELSVATVNSVITSLNTYCNINRNPGIVKALTLNNQTPPAAPSGVAIFVKATLISQGWVVTTD